MAPDDADESAPDELLSSSVTVTSVIGVPPPDPVAALESTFDEGSAISGELSDRPLAHLIFDLYADGFDGTLLLSRQSTKKTVTFRGGYPVAAMSNITAECLGKILHWDGTISDEQRRESLLIMRRTGRRQGEILVEMGLISREALSRGLTLQARFRVGEVFSWTDGSYRLTPRSAPSGDMEDWGISPATLIYEGVRSFMPQVLVMKGLRPWSEQHLLPSEEPRWRFQRLDVSPEVRDFARLIDGTRTLSALLESAGLSVRESSALLYTLLCTRIAETSESAVTARTPLVLTEAPATSIPTKPWSDELVERLVVRLRASSPREILGVPADAPEATLVRAYHRRARERHPDSLAAKAGAETRSLALEALALTAEAFRQATLDLQPPADAALPTQGATPLPDTDSSRAEAPDMDDSVRRILEGERHHQRGLELLDRGKLNEAVKVLARAVSACDEEVEFRVSLAWAVFQAGLDDDAASRALEHLDEAILRSPTSRARLYRSHILLFLDRIQEARRSFEEVLHDDPTNEDAASALARIDEDASQDP